MKIGNVEIENSLALGPMAGMWNALHGNGKCQSYFV